MTDIPRQSMDVDIACAGFGPAMAGFLTGISKNLVNEDGTPRLESKVMPGMPLQVICYERANDLSFGVSGVVTKARAIKESFPGLIPSDIPMAAEIKKEKLLYLLDPIGASRRPFLLKVADKFIKLFSFLPWCKDNSFEIPYIPPFLDKHGGLAFSIGQFNGWIASQVMSSGLVQLWPGSPVSEPIFEGEKVSGVRLADQGVDKVGSPGPNFMPGMDIKSKLTVVGDGPVGSVGQKLDEKFGLPEGNEQKDWAVGMKLLIDLPEGCDLEEGTVIHTIGYPEPEIFGFLYVLPGNVATAGIFVNSWDDNPTKTAYRYLQHWMMHPAIWKHLKGGTMRSWGAKSIQESGKHGEPFLVGDGYARIGEGSGSTNVLTNSGVDEAWKSGSLLAEAVVALAENGKEFTKENLEKAYVAKRENSWLGKEVKVAKNARQGFQKGFIPGMIGTALVGLTGGKLGFTFKSKGAHERIKSPEEYYKGIISPEEMTKIKEEAYSKGVGLSGLIMDKLGWPEIPFDGKLLVSHQDALLMGGKVQANEGYKDHVVFTDLSECKSCDTKLCIEMCSGQAIAPDENHVPTFDREKCVHCGACLWNCTKAVIKNKETNIKFQAGAGGFHSAEN